MNPSVRWLLLGIGVLVGGLLVWFAGPLLAFADHQPLESTVARLLLIGGLLAVLLGEAIGARLHAIRRHRQLFEALSEGASGPAGASAEGMRNRFETAIRAMRDASADAGRPWWQRLLPGSPADDERPWYMFIGSPGSGKTTALIHSDLKFPLADKLGTSAINGVGGTRQCDWWFTDRAVLIDTAGRFTTQDSDARQDASEWQTFLRLLRRHRPRQPINGALVTVSVADLLQLPPDRLQRQAHAVHDRLAELVRGLGNRFPVYLLVTKADLLAGFVEFFDSLNREQRAQVWGMTFDLADAPSSTQTVGGTGADVSRLAGDGLDGLIERLRMLTLPRLQQERDPKRRALIYPFADQLAALKPSLLTFMQAAFPVEPTSDGLPLRGVYLTSGTQEGSPIDRVMGGIARHFHLTGRLLPAAQATGKAFFLNRLLTDVVFREAGLAGTAQQWQRRRGMLRWGLSAAALVLAGLAIGGWSWSALNNARYVDAVALKANVLGDALRDAKASSDLNALTPLYTAILGLANARGVDPTAPPTGFGYGLYQGAKLQQATEQTYRRLLQQTLAPVLAERLLRVMRGGAEGTSAATTPAATPAVMAAMQYEALRTYLMLSQPERLDRNAVRRWVEMDLAASSAAASDIDTRKELLTHVDALMLRNGFQQAVPLDAKAVADARAALVRTSTAARLLAHLKRDAASWELPDFRPDQAAGEAAESLLTRTSGKPLREAIPALYTRDALLRGFGASLPQAVTTALEEETWVLGTTTNPSAGARAALVEEVRRRYLDEYTVRWDGLIGDIGLRRFDSSADLLQGIRRLTAADSAMRRLLQATVRELTVAPAGGDSKGAFNALEAHFGGLRNFVNGGGATAGAATGNAGAGTAGASSLDDVLGRLESLRSTLANEDANRIKVSAKPAAGGGADAALDEQLGRVKADAVAAPEPMRSVLTALLTAVGAQVQRQQREALDQDQRRAVSEGCQQLIAGRYPFTAGARQDISVADFSRLFAAGGSLDDFFNRHLAARVDTSKRPWRTRDDAPPVDAALADFGDPQSLQQFERAADIRRAFFDGNAATPRFQLQMKPLDMDASALQFTLDIDGQVLKYAHGPSLPKAVTWPGPTGSGAVRMQMFPAGASGDAGVRYSGPWALLRLFDAARLAEAGGADRWRASFTVDGQQASYEISSAKGLSPVRLAALQSFKCPGK